MANRLASQSSPYLRQHAGNPVDWYPWGDEAFEKARADSKPIFLSVGYSTCHWCHVMAHESFENEAIARVINEHFVAIKVDREERPDVDRVYMLFVQATTGSGGWPMSVWLTPDLEPFYGGTYFPPVAQWGRPGFVDILQEIARVWREDPLKIRQSAAQVTRQLTQYASARAGQGAAITREDAEAILERAVADFEQAFDRVNGGFGGAPKFPRPTELLFLLREWSRLRSKETRGTAVGERVDRADAALEMVTATLGAMAAGGIHDHLGGGFHRYSVDAKWHVPHFEKMLYDQAQLVLAYVEAFQATGDERLADVAATTLEYVGRDLARPGGGFYSAEDADSVPPDQAGAHASEGAFYVWTAEEVERLLGADAALACARFGIREQGNAESDPHGELAGKNVLYLARPIEELASASEDRRLVAARLDEVRRRLFAARAARPRPGLDDKVIVAWNGLMIAAFARAARVLAHRPAYAARSAEWLRHAHDAAAFVRESMWRRDEQVLLRAKAGVGPSSNAGIEAYAEDYACLVFGLLELFQADGDPNSLEWAIELQRRQDQLFWDERGAGWFSTTGNDASVLLRIKEDYDGAEPSATSVSVFNLLTLARLVGGDEIAARVDRAFGSFAGQLRGTPRAVPMMLAALSVSRSTPREIVIVGVPGRDDTNNLSAAVESSYLPAAVVVPVDPGRQAALSGLLPFVGSMTTLDDRAAAYVCREFACSRPTTDADEVAREIGRRAVE